jgi:hypothetical protein
VEIIFMMDGPMESEEAHRADAKFRRVVVGAGSSKKQRYAAYAAVRLGRLRALNRMARLATGERLVFISGLRAGAAAAAVAIAGAGAGTQGGAEDVRGGGGGDGDGSAKGFTSVYNIFVSKLGIKTPAPGSQRVAIA